ncbi:MAG TPA: Crp/Fnr family transcriptional regulator [Prolixibacteraceae bacterium]|nr:Crp/Fnr family transcriptional regulator [Prolixibacteraceae bacterium]
MEIPVADLPLFRGCDKGEVDELLARAVFQRRRFPPGALIVGQGEPCDRLLIVIGGTVKGEMIGPSGKVLKIEDMEAPSFLASAFLFGKNNHFPVNVMALTEASLIIIPRPALLRIFHENQQVLLNFLSMISSRAQFLSEKLRFLSFRTLKAKMAFYLISEAGLSQSFKIRHSQEELADLFGVARPSVGRIFMQLQEEGLIDIRYRQVSVLDFSKLSELCNP